MMWNMKSEYSSLSNRRVASAQVSILRCSSFSIEVARWFVKMIDIPTIVAARMIRGMRDFIITFLEDRIT